VRFSRAKHDWAVFWGRRVRVLGCGSGLYRRGCPAAAERRARTRPGRERVFFGQCCCAPCSGPKSYLQSFGTVQRSRTLSCGAGRGGARGRACAWNSSRRTGCRPGRFRRLDRSDALAKSARHKALCAMHEAEGRERPSRWPWGGTTGAPKTGHSPCASVHLNERDLVRGVGNRGRRQRQQSLRGSSARQAVLRTSGG